MPSPPHSPAGLQKMASVPAQKSRSPAGHIRLPHRAVPLGEPEHMIVQIPDAVAHLAPHHVAEDEEAVLSRLLMDGVDVELQPRHAQMLQLPEKGSQFSSHSPFLRFNSFYRPSRPAIRRSGPVIKLRS